MVDLMSITFDGTNPEMRLKMNDIKRYTSEINMCNETQKDGKLNKKATRISNFFK